jgi:hypothetical protein
MGKKDPLEILGRHYREKAKKALELYQYLPEKIEMVQNLLRTRYREEIEKFIPRLEKYFQKRGITP